MSRRWRRRRRGRLRRRAGRLRPDRRGRRRAARQCGLKVWVVRPHRARSTTSRARSPLDHEILRVFQQIGVVDDVMPHLEAFTPSEYYRRRRPADQAADDGRAAVSARLHPLERVLAAAGRGRAAARVAGLASVTIALGVDVVGLTQDAAGGHAAAAPRRRHDGRDPGALRRRLRRRVELRARGLPASSSTTCSSTSPGWSSTCSPTSAASPSCRRPACSIAIRNARARW